MADLSGSSLSLYLHQQQQAALLLGLRLPEWPRLFVWTISSAAGRNGGYQHFPERRLLTQLASAASSTGGRSGDNRADSLVVYADQILHIFCSPAASFRFHHRLWQVVFDYGIGYGDFEETHFGAHLSGIEIGVKVDCGALAPSDGVRDALIYMAQAYATSLGLLWMVIQPYQSGSLLPVMLESPSTDRGFVAHRCALQPYAYVELDTPNSEKLNNLWRLSKVQLEVCIRIHRRASWIRLTSR